MATKSFTVTTRNGSTRTVNPKKEWRNKKASYAQVKFIKNLMETRVIDEETAAKIPTTKNPKAGGASDTIKLLLACKKR